MIDAGLVVRRGDRGDGRFPPLDGGRTARLLAHRALHRALGDLNMAGRARWSWYPTVQRIPPALSRYFVLTTAWQPLKEGYAS